MSASTAGAHIPAFPPREVTAEEEKGQFHSLNLVFKENKPQVDVKTGTENVARTAEKVNNNKYIQKSMRVNYYHKTCQP